MAKGYFIANIDVHDPAGYEEYKAKVPATVERFGGNYLVRGGEQEAAEGEAPLPRTVVLEFESLAQAKAWYFSSEYQAIIALRLNAATGNARFVEGI